MRECQATCDLPSRRRRARSVRSGSQVARRETSSRAPSTTFDGSPCKRPHPWIESPGTARGGGSTSRNRAPMPWATQARPPSAARAARANSTMVTWIGEATGARRLLCYPRRSSWRAADHRRSASPPSSSTPSSISIRPTRPSPRPPPRWPRLCCRRRRRRRPRRRPYLALRTRGSAATLKAASSTSALKATSGKPVRSRAASVIRRLPEQRRCERWAPGRCLAQPRHLARPLLSTCPSSRAGVCLCPHVRASRNLCESSVVPAGRGSTPMRERTTGRRLRSWPSSDMT